MVNFLYALFFLSVVFGNIEPTCFIEPKIVLNVIDKRKQIDLIC